MHSDGAKGDKRTLIEFICRILEIPVPETMAKANCWSELQIFLGGNYR
jgi:hypothetical protein